jgi:hypothetical protein
MKFLSCTTNAFLCLDTIFLCSTNVLSSSGLLVIKVLLAEIEDREGAGYACRGADIYDREVPVEECN